MGISTYVRSPIPTWTRLRARSYRGPANTWIPTLKKAGVRYDVRDIPVCMKLSQRTSLQISFNHLSEREARLMKQHADAFHKVAENLPALLRWQRRKGPQAR